jgi:glycine C-acetyltransferase
MPELKDKLWENVNALQSGLRENGFDIGKTNTCVTPVFLKGEVPEAMALVHDLRENHRVFCSIVIYPVIPKGNMILRLIPTTSHTLTDVEETIVAFKAMREKLDKGIYTRIGKAMMR